MSNTPTTSEQINPWGTGAARHPVQRVLLARELPVDSSTSGGNGHWGDHPVGSSAHSGNSKSALRTPGLRSRCKRCAAYSCGHVGAAARVPCVCTSVCNDRVHTVLEFHGNDRLASRRQRQFQPLVEVRGLGDASRIGGRSAQNRGYRNKVERLQRGVARVLECDAVKLTPLVWYVEFGCTDRLIGQ